MILHIISRSAWAEAERKGVYRAASLDQEGFIHFSKPEQVVGTANRFYQGQHDLALLLVDPTKLRTDLRYEPPAESPESSERFPHLYGALNLNAVVRIVDFPPDSDGRWSALPSGVENG